MRAGLVVVGVVLVILGVVLAYVPLVPQAAVNVTASNSPYIAHVTGFSITGSVPGDMTWTSSSQIDLLFGWCAGLTPSFTCIGSNQSWVWNNGTSGTVSFSVPAGGSLVVAVNGSGSASVNIKLAESTIGVVTIGLGILLLILGVVLKRGPVPVPPAPAPAPAVGTGNLDTPPLK
ncbi:MAG: hypothetical protein ACLPZM_09400 [Thermoplasmata archaeon]